MSVSLVQYKSYLPPTTEEVCVFASTPAFVCLSVCLCARLLKNAVCVFASTPAFVCLSVCLCARLLKNACMDLDEMLRVDRCRDMDELINF